MNPIIIPKKFNFRESKWYKEEIKKNLKYFNYVIDNNIVESIIKNIYSKNDYYNAEQLELNFLFFLYNLIISNDIENPFLEESGGKPNNGFEFKNKNTEKYFGIYHAHLSTLDESVIIWYPILLDKGKVHLNLMYINHPKDKYKRVLTKIYTTHDDGYNFKEGEYFINLKKFLDFDIKENKVLKLSDFIKRLK